MSESFYVVSKVAADDTDYVGAVVFNAVSEETDNKAAAEEYAGELATLRPWQVHTVVPASDFDTETEAPSDATSGTD
jgi:hypothetical protein